MSGYEPVLTKGALSNVYDEKKFTAKLRFGSSVLTSYTGKDLTITRNTTGQYYIDLPRSFRAITSFKWGWSKCAAGAVYFPVVLTDNSTVDATPRLVVETRTEAGTATDPASGDEIILEFGFSNDALNDEYDTAI